MKLTTKLKIKIAGNIFSGIGCITGVIWYPDLPAKIFFGCVAILAFAMVAHDFDQYPTED